MARLFRIFAWMKGGLDYRRNAHQLYAVQAMEAGARKLGYDVEISCQTEGYKKCDVACMWGMEKTRFPATMVRAKILGDHRNLNRFVRLEMGYLKRDTGNLDNNYVSVGLGGMWNHGFYRNMNSPSDRWEKLGFELKPWCDNPHGKILVIGQVPWDTQVQHLKFMKWAQYAVDSAKLAYPNNEVVMRPHPKVCRTRPLAEDLEDAYFAVTLNSTTGVECVIEGVPCYAQDRGSMIWPLVGGLDPFSGKEPPKPEREQWAWNLAYTQWTCLEMRKGLPLIHLGLG